MVNLMLNDLCCPTGEGFDTGLEFGSLPLNFYGLIAFTFTGSAEQRKATFFGIIRSCLFDNFGVEHHHICTFVIKYNNPLANANHIRRHTDTAILVRRQSVQQILRHLQIFFCSNLRLSGKEYRIVYYFFNHYRCLIFQDAMICFLLFYPICQISPFWIVHYYKVLPIAFLRLLSTVCLH